MNVAPSTPGRRFLWHLGRGLLWVAIGCGVVGTALGRSVYSYMGPGRSPVGTALTAALFFVGAGGLVIWV